MKALIYMILLTVLAGCTINADIVGWQESSDDSIKDLVKKHASCDKLCKEAYNSWCVEPRDICDDVCDNIGWEEFSACMINASYGSFCDTVLECIDMFNEREDTDSDVDAGEIKWVEW